MGRSGLSWSGCLLSGGQCGIRFDLAGGPVRPCRATQLTEVAPRLLIINNFPCGCYQCSSVKISTDSLILNASDIISCFVVFFGKSSGEMVWRVLTVPWVVEAMEAGDSHQGERTFWKGQ